MPITLGTQVISGTNVIVRYHNDIPEHVIPGLSGGVNEIIRRLNPTVEIHGIIQATADTDKRALYNLVGTENLLTVPSMISGNAFYRSPVLMESLQFTYPAGKAHPYYEYVLRGKASANYRYYQDFDRLTLGAFNGQDNWVAIIGTGTDWNVVSGTIGQTGTNVVEQATGTSDVITRATGISGVADIMQTGEFTCYGRFTGTTGISWELQATNSERVVAGVRQNAAVFQYTNDDGGPNGAGLTYFDFSPTVATAIDTWYKVTIRMNTPNRATFLIDDVIRAQNIVVSGPVNRIRMRRNGTTLYACYWDTISVVQ